MKIYIAATYGRAAEMRKIAERLRDEGHDVTSECWHDSDENERRQEYEEWHRGRFWSDSEPVSFEQWSAAEDIRGIRDADMVVMQADEDAPEVQSTGGRHFEFGLAAGVGGKYLVVIGQPENIFHHVPAVLCCAKWSDFFAVLPVYEHAHRTTHNARKAALRGAG